MNRSLQVCTAAVLMGGAMFSSACRPVEWENPQYVCEEISVGNQAAFGHLSDLEGSGAGLCVAEMVKAYNDGLNRDRILERLIEYPTAESRDLLVEILNGDYDDRASMAARALAELNDEASASLIAARLLRASDRQQFPEFFNALKRLPAAGSADAVAQILEVRAERVGGAATVRDGCEILGRVPSPSESALRALVYSLVNIVPADGALGDSYDPCEMALLTHGDAAVPPLVQMLNGEYEAASNLLRELNFLPLGASRRAAAALSDMRTDAAINALAAWLQAPHAAPVEELALMPVTSQQEWFALSGQTFESAVRGLGNRHSPADLDLLRRLESMEAPGSLLPNFQSWFNLSVAAESGLRSFVYEQLALHGNAADRELLWLRVASATVGNGNVYVQESLRTDVLMALARVATPADMARYEAHVQTMIAANAELQQMLPVYGRRPYFLAASMCGDDANCLIGLIDNQDPVLADATFTDLFAFITASAETPPQVDPAAEDAAAQIETALTRQRERAAATVEQLRSEFQASTREAAILQLGLRLHADATAQAKLLDLVSSNDVGLRKTAAYVFSAMPTLPAEFAARVDAFIAQEGVSSNQAARDAMYRIRAIRIARAR